MWEPCDFFVLILEGYVEVTIGREDHKFQEGPFRFFGEQMLEEALNLPSSIPGQGFSNGSKLPGKNSGPEVIIEPTDTSQPFPLIKSTAWVPDYTVKAVTDVLYLKIRRSTYMVAVNATKMNRDQMKDEDIEKILIQRSDKSDLLRRSPPSLLSPEIMWEDGIVHSMKGTPTDSRRVSTRSITSNVRTKMGEGQSSSSIDRIVIIDTPDVNLAFNDEEHERLLDKDNVTEEIIEESSPQLIVN